MVDTEVNVKVEEGAAQEPSKSAPTTDYQSKFAQMQSKNEELQGQIESMQSLLNEVKNSKEADIKAVRDKYDEFLNSMAKEKEEKITNVKNRLSQKVIDNYVKSKLSEHGFHKESHELVLDHFNKHMTIDSESLEPTLSTDSKYPNFDIMVQEFAKSRPFLLNSKGVSGTGEAPTSEAGTVSTKTGSKVEGLPANWDNMTKNEQSCFLADPKNDEIFRKMLSKMSK